jgi:hypothetical protein
VNIKGRKQQKYSKKTACNKIFAYVELMHMATRDISFVTSMTKESVFVSMFTTQRYHGLPCALVQHTKKIDCTETFSFDLLVKRNKYRKMSMYFIACIEVRQN